MYKKIIAAVLAVTLTVGGLSLPAEVIGDVTGGTSISASAVTYGDFKYKTLSDGTLEITNYNGNNSAVVIPSKINGKSVTSIGERAFEWCGERLTNITIPNSVTSIKKLAFVDCKSLKTVTIPNSVTSIESNAFNGCTNLASITIPNSVTSIDAYAFENTKWLENKRKENPFVTVNGILIDASNCSGDVVIPSGVTSIGNNIFLECTSLTSVTIPNGVTSIGANAFNGCTSLTSITIPNSVTSIGYKAFENCTSLASVTIPDGVTSIGAYAFKKTKWLENKRSENPLVIVNGILIDAETCSGNVVIPNSVTRIGNGAFTNCTSLTSITIPNNVTSIGDSAFYNCGSLKSITIPSSVTSIGDFVFYSCGNLTSIKIPDSITSIGEDAFGGCGKLTSITIPNSVTNIGDWAFDNCRSLTSITIPNSVKNIGEYAFFECTNLKSITIPSSVTNIGYRAFMCCTSLKSVTIPNSVTNIGDGTFYGCTSLASITIPSSVTSIGYEAFNRCTSLKSVTIPNSVTSIENNAFNGCTSLKSLTIPKSVTNIEDHAFGYYYSDVDVYEKVSGFKVSCYSGTAGEKYAKENGLSYVLLDSVDRVTTNGFTSKTNSVTIKWKKVSGATGYRIYKYNASTKKWSTLTTIKNGSTLSYTQSGLKAGTVYKYKVKAYTKSNGTNYWGDSSATLTTATKPATAKITKTSSAKTAVRLYWNKVSGADNYKLQQYDTAKKKWVTVNAAIGSSVTNYKVTGLKKNTSYKFRIQAYKKAGSTKVYGAWSDTKTVRTAK